MLRNLLGIKLFWQIFHHLTNANTTAMKKSTTALLLFITSLTCNLAAQETAEKIMEKRAREMYRVITIHDLEQWKKFISENYSQALIDKPMRAQVNTEENGEVITSTSKDSGDGSNVDKKAKMFGQLHDDFGDSIISSLKVEGATAKLILKSPSGALGTITLRFLKSKPYLIDGLGIEIEN